MAKKVGSPLLYGSTVMLTYNNEYLYSRGFIEDTMCMESINQESEADVMGAIFRVVPQSMHTVQEELSSLISEAPMRMAQERILRQEEALDGEVRTNIQIYSNFKDLPVRFGSLVQLEHIWTHKFLTLKPQLNAEVERDNMRLILEDFGSRASHFRIESCYKFQQEGDGLVRIGDDIILEAFLPEVGRPAYVHCSANINKQFSIIFSKSTIDKTRLEVNASVDHKTAWRLHLYSPSTSVPNALSCGNYIWLNHPEENRCLVAYEHELYFSCNQNDTNGLWKIEGEVEIIGGHVTSLDSFRLRHHSSGKYLAVKTVPRDLGTISVLSKVIASNLNQECINQVVLSDKIDPYSLWRAEPLPGRAETKYLIQDCFYKMVNIETGFVLHSVEESKLESFSSIVPAIHENPKDLPYLKLFRSNDKLNWEALFLLACVPILKDFPRLIKTVTDCVERGEFTYLPEFCKKCRLVCKCIEDVHAFIENKLKGMTVVDNQYGEVQLARQKLFREQNLINCLADILEISFSRHLPVRHLFKPFIERRHTTRVFASDEEIKTIAVQDLGLVCKKIYELISAVCKNNLENQQYAFQFLKVFQEHAGYGLGASKCMIDILSGNELLLLGLNALNSESIIHRYVWLLRKHHKERKPQLLEFLKATCTNNGKGITVNQEKLHECLFGNPDNHSKAIIPTYTHEDQRSLFLTLHGPSGEINVPLSECFEHGRITHYHKDIKYFITMLELFAEMCEGRNYASKTSIKDWFPLPTLIASLQDQNLSLEARAAFCRLITSMHIDSSPREYFKKPEMIRVLGLSPKADPNTIVRLIHTISQEEAINFSIIKTISRRYTVYNSSKPSEEDIKTKSKGVFNFFHNKVASEQFKLEEDDYFSIEIAEMTIFEMKKNLVTFFENFSEDKFNVLSYNLLILVNKMAKFDIYGQYCSDHENSRVIINPKCSVFKPSEMDLVVVLRSLTPILFLREKTTDEIKHFHRRTIKESKDPLLNTKNNKNELSQSEAHDHPVIRSSFNLKNYLYTFVNHRTETEDFETKCKIEILNYIKHYLTCCEDSLIANTIEWFNVCCLSIEKIRKKSTLIPPIIVPSNYELPKEIKIEKECKFKCYKEPEFPKITCALNSASGQVIPKLLSLFAVTESYDIKLEVLTVVLKCYSQRKNLFRSLHKLHAITSLPDTDLFVWTKVNLNIFKQHSEQSELWLKYWQQKGSLKAQSLQQFDIVLSILRHFEYILHKDSHIKNGVPQPGGQEVISADRQQMLRHLGAHLCIMNLVRDGIHTLQEANDDGSPAERLIELFSLCHRILNKFVSGNSKNQKTLFKHLHLFTAHLSMHCQQIPLLCEIFRENTDLCLQASESFLRNFVTLIINEGRQPRFLEIFGLIQVAKGIPLQEVQRRVLKLLLEPEHSSTVLYMENGEFHFEAATSLNANYIDCPVSYHAKLIQILTNCGLGSVGVYLNEAKCQKLLPLKSIIQLLKKAENEAEFRPLKIPLLDFLYHIFIETEKNIDEISLSQDFIQYIHLQAHNLRSNLQAPEDFPHTFKAMMKILYLYYKKYMDNNSKYDDFGDTIAIKEYLEAVTIHQAFIVRYVELNETLLEHTSEIFQELEIPYQFYSLHAMPTTVKKPFEIAESPSLAKDLWGEFIHSFIFNKKYRKCIQREKKVLEQIILDIEDLCPQITSKLIISKLVDFIRVATNRKASVTLIVEVVDLLTELTEKEGVQQTLLSCDTVGVILGLMCDRNIDQTTFKALLKLSVCMLDGGNETVQDEFYQFFVASPTHEVFFERIYKCMNSNMDSNVGILPAYKKHENIIEECLKLLQLFCENHNEKLQNYMRDQVKSRNSYDLVDATVTLLGNMLSKKHEQNFFEISQCFDTLTEFSQGPCFENQNAIIDTKFLEFIADLLSHDENSDHLEYYSELVGVSSGSTAKAKGPMLKGWMVAHLKLKCMNTIHSLLEGRTDNYIITRMIRALNLDIFRANLVNIYTSYTNMYGPSHYDHDVFNHYKSNMDYILGRVDNPQDINPEYHSLLIEVGFLIYHLVRKFKDLNSPEHKELIENELPDFASIKEQSDFLGVKFIGEIGKLGIGMVKDGFNFLAKLAKRKKKSDSVPAEIRQESLESAYYFFETNTGSVEVVFPAPHICKVYFWLPPESKHLTEELKEDFHSGVDRASAKTKLQYLITKNDEIIEGMHHEAWLNKIFFKHKFFALVASNVKFWRNLAFFLTLVLNCMILTSFPGHGDESFIPDPLLFSGIQDGGILSESATQNLFSLLGTIQVVCAGIVTFFFILKKGPVLMKKGWKRRQLKKAVRVRILGIENKSLTFFIKWVNKVKKGIFTVVYVIKSIDVLYHLLYMTFSVLALFFHPFFFAFHLTEVIYRYPALQNVIKSIVIPRKALFLTFVWMMILVYLFSLVGYVAFNGDFNGECSSLLKCLSVVFDQGFKADGGIGGFMVQLTYGLTYYSRVFYDNMYNILIMIISLNIVQGIIIDTFAILRQTHDNNTYDRQNKCFVCGLKKDKIERGTSRPFKFHIEYEHCEWNYVYFIAYLINKVPTDYTGIESHIREQINNKEIDWFPLNKALSLKDERASEENLVKDSLDKINEKVEKLEELMYSLKKQVDNKQ